MAVKKEIMRTGWREAWGILLLAFCVLTLLSLISYQPGDISLIKSPPNDPAANFIGPMGAWLAFITLMTLGAGGYFFPLALGVFGALLIFKREGWVWPKTIWLLLILLCLITLMELQTTLWGGLVTQWNIGSPGGALGHLVAQSLLVRYLGEVGTVILAITALLISMVLLFEVHPVSFFQLGGRVAAAVRKKAEVAMAERRDRRAQLEQEEKELTKRRRRLEEAVRQQERPAKPVSKPAPPPAAREEPESTVPSMPVARMVPKVEPEEKTTVELPIPIPQIFRREKKKPAPIGLSNGDKPHEANVSLPPASSNYQLPPMTLLHEVPPEKDREIQSDFTDSANLLKETFAEFGIEVDVTNVEKGPVVTRYEVLPAPGVRVERIAGLSNNIGLAMKAESVRIQAPIPGKGVVGIEVPNPKTTLVCLREVLESDEWRGGGHALPLALGKDVGGHVLISDLAEMPHMLVAGATGSGKTVCMNSILTGLLMSRTPEQMRLMLIDPKIVEFSIYNHLPHLVVPVITDPKKVFIGLKWAINEMEKRYKLFAKVGVRNIKSFNSRPIEKQTELFGGADMPPPEEEDKAPDRLPYIVIVVDELADLMLVAQAEIENAIARLAQLSRAVGIHMIIATQRPSVNVITGTIKANFPARLAFQVAQKVDSRTILDANGADKLLGKGDLLFLPPGSSKLTRAQGTLTTDQEIRDVVNFIKQQGQPQYEVSIKEKIESKVAELPEMEEDDGLIEQALEIIRQTRRASTSSLQRRLRIGYTRAARIMDLLEERGVVGPAQGSDPREILIDLDGEIPQNTTDDSEQNG